MKLEIDSYDRKILSLLQADARLSYSEIGRRIHLTSPAVAERVRRLEEAQVIQGFAAQVNLRALGYSFEALINITLDSHDDLDKWASQHLEVLAVYATTGEQCALIRVAVAAPEHLQSLIQSLGKIGRTQTAIVLSTQFEGRGYLPADQIKW
ncbi:Lrp/AsnC family transcriptional regulator [Undibacterium flavidum]|uniref:Lrp/AsnC family transcriptional regulator n=1 Tax=Undibacterium flavidum TaxID=2762297 RepID=A0ABR6Y8U5_9BURK|nr:Lrp/AsnC family transcriptional regulator [Undibacterium flavidum]MBC3873006.1 Lrp/AsnC family transcriptional regulator [Undibacterium flavidum]